MEALQYIAGMQIQLSAVVGCRMSGSSRRKCRKSRWLRAKRNVYSMSLERAGREIYLLFLWEKEELQMADNYTSTDKMTGKQTVQEITEKLEQGIKELNGFFGDIAGWGSEPDMKELQSSLETIKNSVSELITGISGRLQELQKDRGEETELPVMEVPEKEEKAENMENDEVSYYVVIRQINICLTSHFI